MLLRHLKYLNLRSPLNNTPPSSPERTTRTTFVAKSKADTNISAMARSKQVAGKSPGRQKITKQSARTTKAPVKKARTSKSKGHVFLFNCWMDYYTIAVSIGERDLVDVQKEFERCMVEGHKDIAGRLSRHNASTRHSRSGKTHLKDADAENSATPNSPSSAIVQSPRFVRGSYDQAPK